MSKMKIISRLAFSLHSWLGLISGVFLLLLGLSGSALVFREEIDHLCNAKLLQVSPERQVLSLDSIYRKIGHGHPNLAGIAWLNPNAAAKNEAYEFRLYQNDGKISTYDLGLLSINPYNGQFLREGDLTTFSPGLMQWLFQFHWSFQLGLPGLLLATVFGVTMLFSTLTGILIYRKYVWKVLLFKVRIKTDNWRTITSGLHRIVGVWALVFNVVIFFTGFWMNKFSMDAAYWKSQAVSAPLNTMAGQPIDKLLRIAKANMPDLLITNIYLPTQPAKTFRARGTVKGQSAIFDGINAIAIDQFSGAVISIDRLSEKSLAEQLEATFYPLHTGNYGGLSLKVFYVIIGLMPGLLSITGALLWWRKRFSNKH
jgi:uncharacterized iron-regulated membrane protein